LATDGSHGDSSPGEDVLLEAALLAFEERDPSLAHEHLNNLLARALSDRHESVLSDIVYVCWRMTGHLDARERTSLERLMTLAARERNRLGAAPACKRLAQAFEALDAGQLERAAELLELEVRATHQLQGSDSDVLDQAMSLAVELRAETDPDARDEIDYLLETLAERLDPPDEDQMVPLADAEATRELADAPLDPDEPEWTSLERTALKLSPYARSQLRLIASTTLQPSECLALVRQIAEEATAGLNYAGQGLRLVVDYADQIGISFAMMAKDQIVCTFTADVRQDGQHTSLRVGGLDDFAVLKHTVLLIPVGKEIAGYGYYKRFLTDAAAALRAEDPDARVTVAIPGT
jgi:hypothetical protein